MMPALSTTNQEIAMSKSLRILGEREHYAAGDEPGCSLVLRQVDDGYPFNVLNKVTTVQIRRVLRPGATQEEVQIELCIRTNYRSGRASETCSSISATPEIAAEIAKAILEKRVLGYEVEAHADR
jgi:hypothetical protein